MTSEVFQIFIDSHLANELREVVNSQLHFSVNQRKTLEINRKKKEYPTWSLVCAIMDRLDDTMDYLCSLELNTGTYRRSAFDFFDFMAQATVIIDCIDMLAKIYDVSFSEENKSTDIFNERGKDGSGTDKKYFEYLRSLCSIHPVETSYYAKTYQDNDFESSPFVTWNDGRIYSIADGDIIARVYTNKNDDYHKTVNINMEKIFEYVIRRYNYLEKIISAIRDLHQLQIDSFVKTLIKAPDEFDSFVEYLINLKEEVDRRLGDDFSYEYDYVISLFQLKLSNPNNASRYQKYCNIFRYAIPFEHNGIQNMNFDSCDCNGIQHPQRNIETTLFHELYSTNSQSDEARKYGYNIQKIGSLNYDSGYDNKQWAYCMLEEAKPFFEKYVTFDGAQGDFEHYALVQIALYFDSLKNKCLLNKNVPNDLLYRDRILSVEEINNLRYEEPVSENAGQLLKDYLQAIASYGEMSE